MNTNTISKLLDDFIASIRSGEDKSLIKACKLDGGLSGRIKRTIGQSIVFDIVSHNKLCAIRASLSKELPQYANLINSQPEIMDGYSWTRIDFIELYFRHLEIVAEKLRRLVSQAGVM